MSADLDTLHVNLAKRSYPIQIGTGNLPRAGDFLAGLGRVSHVVVIADAAVEASHARTVTMSFTANGLRVDSIAVPSGERSKSVESAARLWNRLLELSADRQSVVVAVGGGVVGDLAGFVAATFARGLRFAQIPTTLLAMVDSSVGGKVGVNLPGAKNMVGAFWQPLGVLIDTDALVTLPDREYRAGLAEVVKYGVILDADFFAYLEANVAGLNQRQPDVLRRVIARSCRLKADMVEADEREETGQRAVLNYGHTFCHAIEAVAGYGELLHGEGVAIGMTCAARLAQRLGRIDGELPRRQQELLTALGLPIELPALDRDQLIAAMAHDKKVEHGRLRFILPDRLGHVELVGDVAEVDIRAAID